MFCGLNVFAQAKNWEDWAKHTMRHYKGMRAVQKVGSLEKIQDARDALQSFRWFCQTESQ